MICINSIRKYYNKHITSYTFTFKLNNIIYTSITCQVANDKTNILDLRGRSGWYQRV